MICFINKHPSYMMGYFSSYGCRVISVDGRLGISYSRIVRYISFKIGV